MAIKKLSEIELDPRNRNFNFDLLSIHKYGGILYKMSEVEALVSDKTITRKEQAKFFEPIWKAEEICEEYKVGYPAKFSGCYLILDPLITHKDGVIKIHDTVIYNGIRYIGKGLPYRSCGHTGDKDNTEIKKWIVNTRAKGYDPYILFPVLLCTNDFAMALEAELIHLVQKEEDSFSGNEFYINRGDGTLKNKRQEGQICSCFTKKSS